MVPDRGRGLQEHLCPGYIRKRNHREKKEGVQEILRTPWLHFDFTSWGSYIVLRRKSVCGLEAEEPGRERRGRLKGPLPGL